MNASFVPSGDQTAEPPCATTVSRSSATESTCSRRSAELPSLKTTLSPRGDQTDRSMRVTNPISGRGPVSGRRLLPSRAISVSTPCAEEGVASTTKTSRLESGDQDAPPNASAAISRGTPPPAGTTKRLRLLVPAENAIHRPSGEYSALPKSP